ncbi:hypothetical protein NEMBOFW57_007158 [Staphylotrichum longicolle]|uniref:Uncharacterized protein n=1 Tax=Staphylotrichum longicolle TaxID=669026 RepID=A0AAD4EV16_9PEZI|nr:hypothetical protein NEMBOFW57_007158 [Staphylotrichum longicolle]
MGTTAPTIAQLNERIAALEAENARLNTVANRSRVKLDLPPRYRGGKDALSGFLTLSKAYLGYYPELFPTEVDKFQPTMDDVLNNANEDDREDFINEVFSSYAKFEAKL